MANIKYILNVSSYNIQVDDEVLYVDTRYNAVRLYLPAITSNNLENTDKSFIIYDYNSNCSNNNIIIIGNNNETINELEEAVLSTDNIRAQVVIAGTNWGCGTVSENTTRLTEKLVKEP